ncbi:hypothetical protein PR048_014777 [Dryococelus australis]|uniref:Receptor ligand binding region domain-containing protein n=1 Tax=Dryococelus australis TaxID=614101 RepID=A0ABQ9HFW9_9NEOP|nr:hypothetical protein PR048_014777 [Dryococelus australis]
MLVKMRILILVLHKLISTTVALQITNLYNTPGKYRENVEKRLLQILELNEKYLSYNTQRPSPEADSLMRTLQSANGSTLYVRNNNCSSTVSDSATCAVLDHVNPGSTGYIIISDDIADDFFMETVDQLSRSTFWDCQSRVLLVLTSVVRESISGIEDIVRRYWTLHEILNCVAVFATDSAQSHPGDMSHVQALSFNPFRFGGYFMRYRGRNVSSSFSFDKDSNVNGYLLKAVMAYFPPFLFEMKKDDGSKTYEGISNDVMIILKDYINARLFNNDEVHAVNTSRWPHPRTFYEKPDVHLFFMLTAIMEQARLSTCPFIIVNIAFLVPKAQCMPLWMNARCRVGAHSTLFVVILMGYIEECLLEKWLICDFHIRPQETMETFFSLARLPPRRTGLNPQPGHSRAYACGNSAGRCRWLACFLRNPPFPLPLHSGAASYSPQSLSSALKTSLL